MTRRGRIWLGLVGGLLLWPASPAVSQKPTKAVIPYNQDAPPGPALSPLEAKPSSERNLPRRPGDNRGTNNPLE